LSQINLNQSFTGSFIYDLPFGHGRQFGSSWNNVTNTLVGNWQMTLIERISSGFPVPLIDSNNASGTTFNSGGDSYNYNRPNQVANCNPYAADHSQQTSGSTRAACAAPVAGELGNASRVPVVGPDFVNSDFSLIKQFALPRKRDGFELPRRVLQPLQSSPSTACRSNDINAARLRRREFNRQQSSPGATGAQAIFLKLGVLQWASMPTGEPLNLSRMFQGTASVVP
jgi:hypothetical protein